MNNQTTPGLEPKKIAVNDQSATKENFWLRFKIWFTNHKKLSLPLSLLCLVVLLGLIPSSRYLGAGLVIKKTFTLQVSDATAKFPVSGATVVVGESVVTTDASGTAQINGLSVGHHRVLIRKANYRDQSADILVPILPQKQVPTVGFSATGRQVKVTVHNLINGQIVSGAKVEIDGVKSITDKDGSALAVVSIGSQQHIVTVTASGYNDAKAPLEVTDNQIKDNNIRLTPTGSVYFLSKLSGKIDVVKANLDGSERKTVLAGTGKEDEQNTMLLASSDWRYLALLANRDGVAKLFIINTDDDGLLVMDQSNADFSTVGWHDHYFIYTLARHNYNSWQPNAFSIKSYNADTGKVLTLANTNASGSGLADAEYENFWDIKLTLNDVVYTRTWYMYPGYLKVEGKQNALASIRPDGSNSRQIKTVDAATSYISNLRLSRPSQLEFAITNNDNGSRTYFTIDKNNNLKTVSSINDINEVPTVYLLSPAGDQTFWSEQRDGKNTLFVGDENADGAKQIAALSSYTPYGWYSSQYLLVSKDNSVLYIMPKTGLKSDAEAVKISDYHKPAQSYYGYGGI